MHLQTKEFINKNIMFLIVELIDVINVSELFHRVETTRTRTCTCTVHYNFSPRFVQCNIQHMYLFQTATHSEEVQGIRMEHTEH